MKGKQYQKMIKNKFYLEEELIPISALSDITFCERRAALHFIEGIWEDNLFTAEGTILHERVDDESATSVRGNIRIARSVWIRSLTLGLIGKADVVEYHKTETGGIKLKGVSGFWLPFPVEYKRGHMRHEQSFEIQLCAQTLCLEEMLNAKISCGAIFYGKTRHRLDLEFNESLRQETKDTALRLHEFIKEGKTPKPVYAPKCDSCSLVDVCLPKACGKKTSVNNYLKDIIEGSEK